MRKKYIVLLGLSLFFGASQAQNKQTLNHISSYETTISESAEVVSYDAVSKRAFFTNSSSNSLTIVDISNPKEPTLYAEVSLVDYGGGPNSVDVKNEIVAVAIENTVKTSNGVVVFFDTKGTYLGEVTVGALPDMLTFTADGTKLIVANEGEPNADYSIDPEGTVSIVDLSNGVAGASVETIDFTSYNDKKESLLNKGVRIFGNNGMSSVAQDMEPEYIAITDGGAMAYVSCQENNAFAVIDLSTNSLLDIIPMGYKNHLSGTPTTTLHNLNEKVTNWPVLGTPVYDGGQPSVQLGGFSGLFYASSESTETDQVFYAVPDRGPNDASVKKATVTPVATQNIRPFKLPEYQSRIVKFNLNKTTGNISLDNTILLTRKDGTTPISGRGNIPGVDEVPVTYSDATTNYTDVDYTDGTGEEYHELPFDEYGADLEGVLIDKDGDFWLCDEYRPALYQFKPDGTLIERYVANGTSMLGTTPMPQGTYGKETLPAVYAKRRANRGFEAIAYDAQHDIVYAFIQSPMYNPSSSTKDKSDVIRILGINASTGQPVSEYVYLLERNRDKGFSSSRVDKIGDAVYTGDGKFLVIERDSEGATVTTGKKYVYEIDINFATNILNTPIASYDGTTANKALEELTTDEIVTINNIRPVHKLKVLNLPSVGYQGSDKAEGIALLPNGEIAVLNDNDFGIAGAGVTDNSVLGIISFANDYGFDASNKDDAINITAHPTLGMFMPDGIASFSIEGNDYIITSNEGDSRDYDGYSEEVRVKDLTLNADYYSNATDLQADEDLGRLKTTTANGDYNQDGTTEQIYSYGARSFSIFDVYGNLVFDSGDEFAKIIQTEEPDLFNEDKGKKDGRSDDKGAEPEAVTVGVIGEFTYAFVGLERQSGILVYDITNPQAPEFITYYNNRTVTPSGISGDVAPEIIEFIPSNDSPNNENLLLIGYEKSGSMGIIQVGGTLINSLSEEVALNSFTIYPNPSSEEEIHFDTFISGEVYNASGEKVQGFEKVNTLNVSALEEGVYIIKTKNNGNKRFLKL